MGIVGLLCQRQFWPQFCAAELSQFLLATLQLLGHGCLFLSTLLHARYVLCCTAEPPLSRRRNLAAKAAEPASMGGGWLWWILWPSWLFRSRAAAVDIELDADGKPKKGRKRSAPKKRSPAKKATRTSKVEEEVPDEEEWEGSESASDDESEDADTPSNAKNYRFDAAEEPAGDHFSEDEDNESDDGKGLSKRERRRLQQQQREQERRARR